jgi:hypothetical protein
LTKPRVFLGMPNGYGNPNKEALLSLFSGAVVAVDFAASPCIQNCSLLPHSFNLLLAAALQLRDEGRCTHFAMLHSDVSVEAGWLDLLYAEMVEHRADLVSAVVPIKLMEADPPTSTAVGSKSDPWREPRKIRMSERADLPPTFGKEYVEAVHGKDAVLLVNTGCWLADLRKPHWDGFAFGYQTRMDRDRVTGQYLPRIIPEDWLMSYFLESAGAKVVATTRLTVAHHGDASWMATPPHPAAVSAAPEAAA